jgi:hypothetical protein
VTKKPFPLFWAVVTLTFTLIGLVWGGRNTYLSLRNRNPVRMTCADFVDYRPNLEWVQLSECEADLQHIDVETTEARPGYPRRPTTVYIPLRSRGAVEGRVFLLLASDDSSLLSLGDMSAARRQAPVLKGTIEGTIELSIDRSNRDRELLHNLDLNLGAEFVILDHGSKPLPLWLAVAALATGVFGLTTMGRWLYRRRKHRTPALARAVVTHE